MVDIPNLPHLYQTLTSGGFSESDQMLGRAIADALLLVGVVAPGNFLPSSLPGIDKQYGAAEARRAIAIAEAIKEKGLVFGAASPSTQGGGKEILETPKTFYVNKPYGDDLGNDGLTSETAFKTLSWALNYIRSNYDLNGFTATIMVSEGMYGPLALQNLMLNGKLCIVGDDIDASKVRIGRIYAENIINDLVLDKLTVQESIELENCNTVKISRSRFPSLKAVSSRVKLKEYCHILPGSKDIFDIGFSSTLDASEILFFLRDPVDFNIFLKVTDQSGAKMYGVVFDEQEASGRKFWLEGSSYINTDTNNLDFLPGDISGKLGANCSYDTIVGDAGTAIRVDNESNKLASKDLQGSLNEVDKRLTKLESSITVTKFINRTGDVIPAVGDYDAEDITYRDTLVQIALDQLIQEVDHLARLAKVNSFNGRSGDVQPLKGDYCTDDIVTDGVTLTSRLGNLKDCIENLAEQLDLLAKSPEPVLDQDGLNLLKQEISSLQTSVLKLQDRALSANSGPLELKAKDVSIKPPNGFAAKTVQKLIGEIVAGLNHLNSRISSHITNTELLADDVEKLIEHADLNVKDITKLQTQSATLKGSLDYLSDLVEENKHNVTKRVYDQRTIVVPTDMPTGQEAVDYVLTQISLDRSPVIIKFQEEYSQEFIVVRGCPKGIHPVYLEGYVPDICFEGANKFIIAEAICTGVVHVGKGSYIEIEDAVFIPAHGLNILVEHGSTVILDGELVVAEGKGTHFAAVEHQSTISFAYDSKLIVDRGVELEAAFIQGQFNSTVDVRQVLIQSTNTASIKLVGQSLLLGVNALPDTTEVDADETSAVIA